MKKTFKGTINGKEFDSVVEYNKYMCACLAEGKKVEASAYTKVDEEEDEDEEKENQIVSVEELTPSFEGDDYLELNRFDRCNGKKEIDSFLDKLDTKYSERYTNLMKKLNSRDKSKTEQWLTTWNNCMNRLYKYYDVNNLAENSLSVKIKEAESNLRELKERKEKLYMCQTIINRTRALYESLLDGGQSHLEDLNSLSISDPTPGRMEELRNYSGFTPTTTFNETSPQNEHDFTDEEIQKAADTLAAILGKCIW